MDGLGSGEAMGIFSGETVEEGPGKIRFFGDGPSFIPNDGDHFFDL